MNTLLSRNRKKQEWMLKKVMHKKNWMSWKNNTKPSVVITHTMSLGHLTKTNISTVNTSSHCLFTWYCICILSFFVAHDYLCLYRHVPPLRFLFTRLSSSFMHWTPEKRDADAPWMWAFQEPAFSWFSPGFCGEKKTRILAEILEFY